MTVLHVCLKYHHMGDGFLLFDLLLLYLRRTRDV